MVRVRKQIGKPSLVKAKDFKLGPTKVLSTVRMRKKTRILRIRQGVPKPRAITRGG